MTKSEARFISDTLSRVLRNLNRLTQVKLEWQQLIQPINDDIQSVYDAARAEIGDKK